MFNSYDLIWCAGAAYFKGFLTVLDAWRDHLNPGGAIAFSEPALTQVPPNDDVAAFWDGEGDIHDLSTLDDMLAKGGWQVLGQRWIIGEGWDAYYGPKADRVQMLKSQEPHPALQSVIERTEKEIDLWRKNRDQIAYSLFVVRPA